MTTDTTTDPQDAPEQPAAAAGAAPDPASDTAQQTDPDEHDGNRDEGPSGNAEAAKYRTRLRATEAERDTLAVQLDALRRAEATRVAADVLADGADLFRDDTDLDALLADDGTIDVEAVRARADELIAAHPHWSRHRWPVDTGQGRRGGHTAPASWADALRRS